MITPIKPTRNISWIKAAKKDFADFPKGAADEAKDALAIIANGGTPIIAKPLTGLGTGVSELVIKERGDAFRIVYALQIDEDIFILHALKRSPRRVSPRQNMKSTW